MIREKVKIKFENNLQIISRKILIVLLSTIIGVLTVNWLASFLPQYYESKSLLTINPPTIAGRIEEHLSDKEVLERINTFNTEVLSNSSLKPMVKKYKIEYKENLPIEIIVEKMRGRIQVKPMETHNAKVTAFQISYKDENPETARNVVQELATKYINIQTLYNGISCTGTTEKFIDLRLEEKKLELDKIEEEKLSIMRETANLSTNDCNSSIDQLDGLRRKEKVISKENKDLFNEKSRFNQKVNVINGQINLIEKFQQNDSKSENELRLLEVEKNRIEKRILKIDQKIKQKESELNKINVDLTKVELKIISIPNIKDALEDINNKYYKVKSQYNELLKKREEVILTTQRGVDSIDSQIKVVDPANLPKYVTSPNSLQVIGIGAGLGFFLGLGLLLAIQLRLRFRKIDLR